MVSFLKCNCSVPIHASKYYYSSSQESLSVSRVAGSEWCVGDGADVLRGGSFSVFRTCTGVSLP